MAIDARGFSLVPQAGGNILGGAQALQGIQQRDKKQINQERLRQLLRQGQAGIEQARQEFPVETQKFEKGQLSNDRERFDLIEEGKKRELSNFVLRSERAATLKTPEQQESFLRGEAEKILAINPKADVSDTLELADDIAAGRGEARLAENRDFGFRTGILKDVRGQLTAGQREFEQLTGDLTEDQKKQATLIKLGISPRAVGSAIQTITSQNIQEEIGDAEATIGQRKKFGELTGKSRADTIDKGFEKINKINQGLDTIDRAIGVLQSGAGTGAIERFLPSIKAASVELDQIRNQFALDVIGSVTLGAISEAELDLAKQTGLPTGLNEQELIDHLQKRKAAQEKLRAYFEEQIDFLDKGGSVAGFLREKQRQRDASPQAVPAETAQPEQQAQPQAVKFLGFE